MNHNKPLRTIGVDKGVEDWTTIVKVVIAENYVRPPFTKSKGRKFVKSRVVEPKQIKGNVI